MHGETVFIVDDDASVRDALALLLSLRGHVTASFASAEDFLGALQPAWKGCVIADIRMPGMSGLELQQVLQQRQVRLPVIVMTAHGDIAAARQAFLAQAVDFIEKPFEADQMLAAVAKALSGVRAMRDAERAQGSLSQLSGREHEVMNLMVQGLHNRNIADTLAISPRTVEVHKARVLEKMGVRNVVELIRLVGRR